MASQPTSNQLLPLAGLVVPVGRLELVVEDVLLADHVSISAVAADRMEPPRTCQRL